MRCLTGEESAWEKLFRRCHPPLLEAIGFLLGAAAKDGHQAEEIAARVWYALLRDQGRLLARYDPDRDSSLRAFFAGLARIEMMRHQRSERRRKRHELKGGRRLLEEPGTSDSEVLALIDEFAATLTPGEKEFMEDYLTSPQEGNNGAHGGKLSETSIWQRRHRIRRKLRAFLEDL